MGWKEGPLAPTGRGGELNWVIGDTLVWVASAASRGTVFCLLRVSVKSKQRESEGQALDRGPGQQAHPLGRPVAWHRTLIHQLSYTSQQGSLLPQGQNSQSQS